MNARSRLLATAPGAVTPERVALAAVAALALAVTPPFLATNHDVSQELGGSGAATAFTVLTTTTLSVLLARRALRATSPRRARLYLVLGGCVAGALDTLLFYAGLNLFHAHPSDLLVNQIGTAMLLSIVCGAPLGGLFGIMCSPVIVTATRASLSPSLDAVDRVLFATGASLLLAGAAWLFGSAFLSRPATLATAGVAGAIAAGTAAARLVARVRFLERARAGVVPGFRVTPRTGREEEDALLPLVRTEQLGGVLIANGANVPYRGERGVFQLALAPLPDEPFHRHLAGLVRGALTEVANTLATLVVGLSSIAVLVVLFLLWAFRDGLG